MLDPEVSEASHDMAMGFGVLFARVRSRKRTGSIEGVFFGAESGDGVFALVLGWSVGDLGLMSTNLLHVTGVLEEATAKSRKERLEHCLPPCILIRSSRSFLLAQ